MAVRKAFRESPLSGFTAIPPGTSDVSKPLHCTLAGLSGLRSGSAGCLLPEPLRTGVEAPLDHLVDVPDRPVEIWPGPQA